MSIHAQAVVDPRAQVDVGVEIGPFTWIGPDVQIGKGTKIANNVSIGGPTTIGQDNDIFSQAAIGGAPQDVSYRGEPTRLEIGDRNEIREFVTFNRGTLKQSGVTRIGSDNLIMAYVHIAHDCIVGNHTILANNTTLAGHVIVDDYATCGGLAAVHQFCHLGSYCYIGNGGAVLRDVPPYVIMSDYPIRPRGINKVGLQRHGFSAERIKLVRQAYRILYRQDLALDEARSRLASLAPGNADIALLVDFLADSKRSISR